MWSPFPRLGVGLDPAAELLARYFDVHVYFANWGSRRLMFRLPLHAVTLRTCAPASRVVRPA